RERAAPSDRPASETTTWSSERNSGGWTSAAVAATVWRIGNDARRTATPSSSQRLSPPRSNNRSASATATTAMRTAPGLKRSLSLLHPQLRQVHNRAHGQLHVLHAHPLEPRVESVLAREQVRRRQPHLGEDRAVRAAADAALARRDARLADGLARQLQD